MFGKALNFWLYICLTLFNANLMQMREAKLAALFLHSQQINSYMNGATDLTLLRPNYTLHLILIPVRTRMLAAGSLWELSSKVSQGCNLDWGHDAGRSHSNFPPDTIFPSQMTMVGGIVCPMGGGDGCTTFLFICTSYPPSCFSLGKCSKGGRLECLL